MYAISAQDGHGQLSSTGTHPAVTTCVEVAAIWLTALLVVALLSVCGVNPAIMSNTGAVSNADTAAAF